ncbi:PREDICTED: gamma-aminobutyric acid type B receptor subunit 1-like, partial [Wasmannia auropunctata]|uniref:gamma-aminobutyric acid type B receptor subunit 1-like n=1 Tax=Wasmannia auropunctata TaxID=64793 RepID=UPI0005EF76D4
MATLSALGIVIAIGLIVFNVYNRHRRVIYSSHPTANTIMLIGIIGCFLAVLCIGFDGRFVTPWQFLIVCQARAWTMSVGFTLAFGAMFSKVWRVHRLSTKAKADQGKFFIKMEPSCMVCCSRS